MRVLICAAQAPFVESSDESRLLALNTALTEAGHQTAVIRMPLLSASAPDLLRSMMAWRMLDLSEINGLTIDRAIALEFPAYLARHPRKVLWLSTPHDLARETAAPRRPEPEQRVAELVARADARLLPQAHRVFATSHLGAERLRRRHGIAAETLYRPPLAPSAIDRSQSGDYIFCPGPLNTMNDAEPLLNALAQARTEITCVISATEPQGLTRRIDELGLGRRVRVEKPRQERELIERYAGALAVYTGSNDQDLTDIALQAFACAKPLLSLAGTESELIESGVNGLAAGPDGLAAAIDRIAGDRAYAKRLGEAGAAILDGLDFAWPKAVARLLE